MKTASKVRQNQRELRAHRLPLRTCLQRNRVLYLFLIPAVLMVFLFNYMPLFGLQIAFRDYTPVGGFFGSEWVGMKNFARFFNSPRFWPVFLNQVTNLRYKKAVQNITCMPCFISTVVLVGMINIFLSPDSGLVNGIIQALGGEPRAFLNESDNFLSIYIISAIWQP